MGDGGVEAPNTILRGFLVEVPLFKTMVLKIADEYRLHVESNTEENRNLVVVREYCEERDKASVEKMERQCDVGQKGKPSIFTDLLGDPICRVRHFPSHVMLVNTIYTHTYILPSTNENDAFICMSFNGTF